MIKIFFLGEIVGKPGIFAVKKNLKTFVDVREIDFVVANGDGTTNGSGIGREHAIYLRKLGIHAISGGDKIYSKVDLVENFSQLRHVLRPANYSAQSPGSGIRSFSVKDQQVAVISLLGQAWHYPTCDNPFTCVLRLLEKVKTPSPFIIVDFHSYSTAEKQSMGHILDGKVSLMAGTGQRVQTTDLRIMPGRTAMITDVGRCGSLDSVGGLNTEVAIRRLTTGIPEVLQISEERPALQGVVVDLDEEGKATSVERVTLPVESTQDQSVPMESNPRMEEK